MLNTFAKIEFFYQVFKVNEGFNGFSEIFGVFYVQKRTVSLLILLCFEMSQCRGLLFFYVGV